MEKQIFKVGDKVYHFSYGWGDVTHYEAEAAYPVIVEFFSSNTRIAFTNEGRLVSSNIQPTLSFTEYTLQGFSQERPINYEDYKGKWCVFWDDDYAYKAIRKFEKYIESNNGVNFLAGNYARYKYCKLLSDEMIKELELDETFEDR